MEYLRVCPVREMEHPIAGINAAIKLDKLGADWILAKVVAEVGLGQTIVATF